MKKARIVKTAGIGENTELKDLFHLDLQSKVDVQAELQQRFDHASTNREKERAKAQKLFRNMSVSRAGAGLYQTVTTPPSEEQVEKEREAMNQAPPKPVQPTPKISPNNSESDAPPTSKLASIAPRVDAFLEKNAHLLMTDAQRRYPELLKVAAKKLA